MLQIQSDVGTQVVKDVQDDIEGQNNAAEIFASNVDLGQQLTVENKDITSTENKDKG